MPDIHARLQRTFSAVFPELPPQGILAASTETVDTWDSLAAITLLAVLEQEFSVHIDPVDLPELNSFDAIHAHITRLVAVP